MSWWASDRVYWGAVYVVRKDSGMHRSSLGVGDKGEKGVYSDRATGEKNVNKIEVEN